jgi:Sel1 repeat
VRRLIDAISVLTALALGVAGAAAAGPYEDGLTASQHGDFAQALRLFREAADKGDARAQFNLGWMDREGQGGPQDFSGASVWFEKAADQGNPGAQFNLGFLYQNGLGVPRNEARAASWYLKAATQGYASAQVRLAAMYATGHGVPVDREQARAWYSKAAEQGDVDGEHQLARLYLEDARNPAPRGVTQDHFRQLMNSVFGVGRWRETGGYRTPAKENQLRAQGAETVPVGTMSRHSLGAPDAPGAYDVVVENLSPDQAAMKLRRAGAEFRRLFPEGTHGTQGAHLHIEPYPTDLVKGPVRQSLSGSGASLRVDTFLNGVGPAKNASAASVAGVADHGNSVLELPRPSP